MGIFTFRNSRTGREKQLTLTIAEAEKYEKDNPQWKWLCGAPLIHSGRGLKKPDSGFRDVLRKVKKNNRGSTFDIP